MGRVEWLGTEDMAYTTSSQGYVSLMIYCIGNYLCLLRLSQKVGNVHIWYAFRARVVEFFQRC